MASIKSVSTILGSGIAMFALCGAASAGGLGGLKSMAGGTDMSSMASGSAGNAAGIVEFCIKNNYLSGDAASSVKDKLMGKIGGSDESETDKAGYADGANGILKTSDGKSVDLAKMGGAGKMGKMGDMAKMGDMGKMKDSMTKKACSSVLDHAKSFL